MRFYNWTVKISVADDMVADGLDLTPEALHEALCRAFPYARMSGFKVEIVQAPDANEVAREMGYANAIQRSMVRR